MTTRIRRNEEGDLTLPRELLEEEVQDGVLLAASHDEQGNVVLRRLKEMPVREYTDEDLAEFAEEDEMSPLLRARFERLLKREPRLFRR